jgi:hypothetical protein
MRTRTTLATAILAGQLLATLGLGVAPVSAARGLTLEAQARTVVGEFFETINARQFGKTCDLLSRGFYRQNHIPDRKRCVLGLTVGLTNSPTVFFRILGVRVQGDGAIVRTRANGAPGQIVVVRESGALKILKVVGV